MSVQYLLKVSLHGMNDRMQIMMASYLELNCKGIACVVDELDAEVEIVDVDLSHSKNILQQRLEQQPAKPIIVISLYDDISDLAIYVKKPIETNELVNALNKAKRAVLAGKTALKVRGVVDNSKAELPVLVSKQSSKTQKIVEFRTETITQEDVGLAKPYKSKRDLVTEMDEARELIDVSEAEPINEIRNYPEVDKFLKEFNDSSHNKILKPQVLEKEKNRRDTVRYVFQAVDGCVKKHSLLGFDQRLPISIETVSSNGALIKMEKKLKLKGNVTLEIQLDSQKIFIIPAKVIRKNSSQTYGLAFSDYQHKLTEYLIDSGRSFSIM